MADGKRVTLFGYGAFSALVTRVQERITGGDYLKAIALLAEDPVSPRIDIQVHDSTPDHAREEIARQAREAVADSGFTGIEVSPPYAPAPGNDYIPACQPSDQRKNVALRKSTAQPLQGGMSTAASMDCSEQGTAGWFFVVNGVLVAMSNWHVLCSNGNLSQTGRDPVWFACRDDATARGELYHFVPLDTVGGNRLDLALARALNPSSATGQMAHCADPAPVDLYRDPLIPGGPRLFRADGQRSRCKTGRRMIGTINVRLYGRYWMEGQLVFEKLAQSGDSGAAVVDEQSNRVAGLFFMAGPTSSLACPIGPVLGPSWVKTGDHDTGQGLIPIFDGPLP